ncbi:uncharacterized protein METZ01_LOCUS332237 [marine metagenome]|uniref:Uncharacterized protein n=1 Tax=marine metagenome TaxID=408172 RepID=A0A382Q1C9_9ZZZZ
MIYTVANSFGKGPVSSNANHRQLVTQLPAQLTKHVIDIVDKYH